MRHDKHYVCGVGLVQRGLRVRVSGGLLEYAEQRHTMCREHCTDRSTHRQAHRRADSKAVSGADCDADGQAFGGADA